MALTVRERIIDRTMRLFSRRGYAAVGLNEIVAKAKAPKGSLYHYFPGGKEELAVAAMRHGAALFRDTLSRCVAAEGTTAAALRQVGEQLAGWMEESRFRDGSPLTAVTVEMAGEAEAVRAACADGYAGWQAALAASLGRDGFAPAEATRHADWIIGSLEGATVLARARADAAPIREITALMAAAIAPRKPARRTA